MPRHPYRGRKDRNPDPHQFLLVTTKEGSFFRRRRGTVKPAPLNAPFRQSADGMSLSSPAVKRLRACLWEVLRGLAVGRIQARLSGRLNKAFLQNGRFDFSAFAGYEFQEDHPLDSLLLAPYTVQTEGGEARVRIPLDRRAVKQKSSLVSDYYFELVVVWGDAGREGGLRLDSVSSPLYPFGRSAKRCCELSLSLPGDGVPWMLLLKASCLEGRELAHHPRHYGMKVVAVGGEETGGRSQNSGVRRNGQQGKKATRHRGIKG
ncbi:MAG TPA: hypothetical protein VGN63_12780 [Flavisolibacter sp.]|nr:hypothetical protein [Flavisolibacter sp.]